MSHQTAKKTRVRNDFTETEEQDLVEFLADYDVSARAGIFPYRKLTEKPYGSNHSAESWLSRYKRLRSIYDVRIEGFILKNSLLTTHRANEDEESIVEPVRKKPRLQSPPSASDIDETFGNLPISFERFMKNPSQLSQRDQWIGLNLAVNFLCETYGINPEVVYATWERNGNLTNTAAHFRDQRGNDTATEPLQMCDFRHDESDDVASQPAAGPSKHERSSCRAISSADELPSLPAIAPKKRVRSRKRAPHMEIVPTSEPGEGDDSSSGSISQPMVPAPRKQIQPTAVREAPKSSPKSGHSPRVLDAHPSDADDSNSEESDSSSEGSKSDTEPSAPQRRSGASMPSRSDPPARSMESESSFDMSLSDQKQISDVENRTDSASEASVQQSLLCPTPHDQPTTTASRLNYESMNQSASDEGDSDVEDAAMLPEDPPLQAKVASQSESEQFELFSQRNCSESSGNSNVPDKSSNGDYESSYIPTQVSLFGRM